MAVLAQRIAPAPPTLTDHELVAGARGGSDRDFEELYRRYAGRISGFVAGYVRDSGRAEDITQEVFLNALRRLRATESPVAFKPWVFEIARNACIDEFRRGRRGSEVTVEDDELEQARPVAAPPSPEAALAARQQLEDLRGAFHGLSPQHHQLLVLREFEGRSYEDIGARLGMSRPMVESGLFRARRKLHSEYDELVTGRRCAVVQAAVLAGDELGVRQRRQLARHLAHCQPCRRVARTAGLPDYGLGKTTVAGRIAALLPIPWLPRLPWRASRGPRSLPASLRQVPQVQSVASLADSAGPLQSLGRAAAAVAAIIVAGAGGGALPAPSRNGESALRTAAAARSPAPAAIRAGARPQPRRSPAPGSRARPRASRHPRTRWGGSLRPAWATRASAARPPVATRTGPPASRPPAMGSPTSRLIAAAGTAGVTQSAGTVVGTAAGLAQAAFATAQSVSALPAVSHGLARTVAAAKGAVAASAGTAVGAARSTVTLTRTRK